MSGPVQALPRPTERRRRMNLVPPGLSVTRRAALTRRYYTPPPSSTLYPPEVHEYNEKFTTLLQDIKKRHDPTVTTVAQGVLEWKRKQGGGRIGQSIQEWLDRFYMSRIGIRFLIGQRECRCRGGVDWGAKCTRCSWDEKSALMADVALNTLQPHPDYVGIICTRAVRSELVFRYVGCANGRTCTISATRRSVSSISPRRLCQADAQKTPDTSAKSTMRCSRARPSSFSARKTSPSPMSLGTCELAQAARAWRGRP